MKILLILVVLTAGFIFTPSSADAMCYYNRNVDCEFNVRWRPAAVFDTDSLWRVVKGDRKCSVDNDGKIDLIRFVVDQNGCFDNCVINGVINVPDPGGGMQFDVPIFPKCSSNAKIEDHGWASLYLSSDYKPELGCGCGNWIEGDIKGACPDIGKAQEALNNDGFECLIFDDAGKKIFP